jgi:hypothetical protein
MEILVTINNENKVLSIQFFEEKINSKENIYLDLSQQEINKYIDMIPHLYYINNSFINKDNNKFKLEDINIKIQDLKLKLNSTDYKITKCYEAFMRQLPLPYNLEELAAQRDLWRAEINQLEEELKQYEI